MESRKWQLAELPQTPEAIPHLEQGVAWYTFPALSAFEGEIFHGFSTRIGGVSSGYQASLNLGNGEYDTAENIRENFARLGKVAGFDEQNVVVSQQVHGVDLMEIKAEHKGMGLFKERNFAGIDGIYSREKGVVLVTTYADCGPLLFYAPDKKIVATAHAGWRGTAAGMAAHAVRRLKKEGCDSRKLVCVIGPCAGPQLYQVSEFCAAHFVGLADEQGSVVLPKGDKFRVDIPRANRCFLLQEGMDPENIHIAGICTIANPDIFYSHRAAGGEKSQRGSLAAWIGLQPAKPDLSGITISQ